MSGSRAHANGAQRDSGDANRAELLVNDERGERR